MAIGAAQDSLRDRLALGGGPRERSGHARRPTDCRQADPDFLDQLSALTEARDLDWIRTALGERVLNYVGVSWGTYLGVVYRSVFPGKVGRMFLDSVVNLQDGTATLETEQADAAAREGVSSGPRLPPPARGGWRRWRPPR